MIGLKELLMLKALPGIGTVKINKDYLPFAGKEESFGELMRRLSKDGHRGSEIERAMVYASELEQRILSRDDYSVITIFDDAYPMQFLSMGNNKPGFFFAKGNTTALEEYGVAVIGTRKPVSTVASVGPKIVSELLKNRKTNIISGLALGCDAIAHSAAIDAGGITTAVLPCGFDVIEPKRNIPLAERILENKGLLISEYLPEEKMTRFTPVQRDSLIAGLADAVISMQCGVKSGTMHTLKAAHGFSKPIACYIPEKPDGDFEGNISAIKDFRAVRFADHNELRSFLANQKTDAHEEEQMSIFGL